uniref:Sulfotransferase n=1 Tax=Taeniopygia guttata TaxID=59729 RepID=A0A674GG44_TAEGU
MGSSHPRAAPRPGAEQPHARGQTAGLARPCWGLLPLLRGCLGPPHSAPGAASRGETEARLSCGCCASRLAPAVHPGWLQLCCPAQPGPWWGFWEWHGATWRWPARLDTSCCAVLGWEPSPAVPAAGSSGWARCGAGIPRLSRPPSRGEAAPRFSWAWEGREGGLPPLPSPPVPSRPIPGVSGPAAALSRRWPQQDSRSPAGMCRGVPAPRPPGPLPLSPLFKRLPARPARPGHGAHGGDRDLRGHRPARPPPHPGVPRLRRRLRLPPHRRAHRHLPQIGHHLDAGDPDAALQPRRCPPGQDHPQLGAGALAGADLLPGGAAGHRHPAAPHLPPARPRPGPRPAAQQGQGERGPRWSGGPCGDISQLGKCWGLSERGGGESPRCGGDAASLQVIYVARNPKDVAVSFYHFHHLAKFLPDPGSFDAFLTQFLEGTVHYGSWFDHVKGWLGQRHLLDILYVTYEELHQVSPAVSPSCPHPCPHHCPVLTVLLPRTCAAQRSASAASWGARWHRARWQPWSSTAASPPCGTTPWPTTR